MQFQTVRHERELDLTMASQTKTGITVLLTGFSAAGKSTIASALARKLEELPSDRKPILLDGDVVRKMQSAGLGFSKEDRNTHIRRVGALAAEHTAKGDFVICAVIAPYDDVRKEVRRMVEQEGRFVLVLVDTPLNVCEERDPKGLYAKARAGVIEHFTGVSDPYEVPTDFELAIDTTTTTPEQAAAKILEYLASN
jgi:sulfate adenylyltransferase